MDIIYAEQGVVERGKGWGHQLGFPTANIPCSDGRLSGTYAGHVTIADDTIVRDAAIYVDQERKLLESHILDFSGDLYGQTISVELCEKIAEKQGFTDEKTLLEFISQSVAKVREFFRNNGH